MKQIDDAMQTGSQPARKKIVIKRKKKPDETPVAPVQKRAQQKAQPKAAAPRKVPTLTKEERKNAAQHWKTVFTQLSDPIIFSLLKKDEEWVLKIASEGLDDPGKAGNKWFVFFSHQMIAIGKDDCEKNVGNLYRFVMDRSIAAKQASGAKG